MITLYSTWPDAESAEAAARALIAQRLIACANIIAAARSVYEWEGAIQTEQEAILFAKTGAAAAQQAQAIMASLHPYETPCIVALQHEPLGSSPAYLAWLAQTTGAAT